MKSGIPPGASADIPTVPAQLPRSAAPPSFATNNEWRPRYNHGTKPAPVSVPDRETVFIAVMGAPGAGRTTFINTLSPSALKVEHRLRSCTSEVKSSDPFMVMGRKIVLFDMPGFDDINRSDMEILTEIALFLTKFYEQKNKLIAVIYLHDISLHRMAGAALRNWDLLPTPQSGEERQRELENDPDFFKPILTDGATIQPLVKGENPVTLIENIIRKNKPTNIRLIEEMREGKKINETDAGRELNKKIDIEEMTRQAHQKQEMQEQIRANNQAQLDMLIGMLKEANEAKRPRLPGKGKAL